MNEIIGVYVENNEAKAMRAYFVHKSPKEFIDINSAVIALRNVSKKAYYVIYAQNRNGDFVGLCTKETDENHEYFSRNYPQLFSKYTQDYSKGRTAEVVVHEIKKLLLNNAAEKQSVVSKSKNNKIKAFLELELFGEDSREYLGLCKTLFDNFAPGLISKEDLEFGPSSWVAEIKGFDEKYKYQRSFLKSKKDYSRANSKGSRGVFAEFILQQGKIYEVRSQHSNKGYERYFCKINDAGDIVTIEEKEVIECLKSR